MANNNNCKTMNRECKAIFSFIRENILEIKKSQEKHLEGSEIRRSENQQVLLDIGIVKTNLANHLEHHTQIKQSFQWRVGLIVGLITFAVSLSVSLIIKLI